MSYSRYVLLRDSVCEIPNHYERVDGQNEWCRVPCRILAIAFMGCRTRNARVSSMTGWSAPPPVLRVFQTQMLLYIVMHFFLSPTQRKGSGYIADVLFCISNELCAVFDTAFRVPGNDHALFLPHFGGGKVGAPP